MSQIKSYLSLESMPSLEFRTPMKNPIQTLTTNHSMSLSNTLGSLDNKSLWNRRTFYNSHEVDREPIYQAHDFVEERSQQIQNNSAVTLSPAITQQDLFELVNSVKMIAFLTQLQQQQSIRIQRKATAVKALKEKIFMLEQQAKFRKRQFEKKEKDIKSRSLSMHNVRRATSKSLKKEIVDLKLEISQMKRTISQKKATIQSRRNSQEKRHVYPATERKRQKIYVPIVSSPFFAASPPLNSRQRQSSYYQSSSTALPTVQRRQINTKQILHPATPVNISVSHSNKGSSSKNNSKRSSYAPPSAHKHPSDTSQLNVLDLIQEKLRMPSGLQKSPLQTQIIKSQNPQLLTTNRPGLFQILAPALRQQISQNYNINVLKEEPKQPNLDYFNQEIDELDLDGELLMHSQQSRKSIRALKQTSKSHTNKWRKDEEDKQIVEMLKESIKDSPVKPAQIKIQINESPKKNEMGGKLVETNLQQQESFSMELAQKSKNRQCPSPERIQNASQVQIFVADLTDERIKNQSGASDQNSDKRLSLKNIQRNNFSNSVIGIDVNQSLEDCPQLSIESKVKPKEASPQNLAIDRIEELPEEAFSRTVTPASPGSQFRLTTHLEPSVESRYTETPRETIVEPPPQITKEASMGESRGSSLQKSVPTTPVLSRPPSLLQQEQQDDQSVINSIQLNTNSRHSIQSPSRINKMNQIVESPQEIQSPIEVRGVPDEEQDDLFEIRLNNMSKISRQKSSSQRSIPPKDQDNIPQETNKKMAQSELAPRSSYEDDLQGMEAVESELRKSTNSVIILKKSGSAITRSGARKEVNALKTSNRVSSLSLKSKQLSSPIEQADEQQEDYNSIIVKKHKRYGTDLEH